MSTLKIFDCINKTCPWSGDPVCEEALTLYKGHVVGFCNQDCRNKFETAVTHFETIIKTRGSWAR